MLIARRPRMTVHIVEHSHDWEDTVIVYVASTESKALDFALRYMSEYSESIKFEKKEGLLAWRGGSGTVLITKYIVDEKDE